MISEFFFVTIFIFIALVGIYFYSLNRRVNLQEEVIIKALRKIKTLKESADFNHELEEKIKILESDQKLMVTIDRISIDNSDMTLKIIKKMQKETEYFNEDYKDFKLACNESIISIVDAINAINGVDDASILPATSVKDKKDIN